jgi:hypothetical protein
VKRSCSCTMKMVLKIGRSEPGYEVADVVLRMESFILFSFSALVRGSFWDVFTTSARGMGQPQAVAGLPPFTYFTCILTAFYHFPMEDLSLPQNHHWMVTQGLRKHVFAFTSALLCTLCWICFVCLLSEGRPSGCLNDRDF